MEKNRQAGRQFNRGRCALVIALLGVAGFTTAEAGAVSPVRAKIGFCEAVAYPDSDGGALGYRHGAGNIPTLRTSGFSWGVYSHKGDDVGDANVRQQVLAATHRIEICLLQASTIVCPADGKNGAAPSRMPPWVLYDEQSPDGSGTLFSSQSLSNFLRNEGDSNVSTDVYPVVAAGLNTAPELDWANPANLGKFMVLVTNRGYGSGEDAIQFTDLGNGYQAAPAPVAEGGYCPVYAFGQASPTGHYQVFSLPAGLSPFALNKQVLGLRSGSNLPSVLDPCAGGFNYGDVNFCTPDATSPFLPVLADYVGDWQAQIVPGDLTPPIQIPFWANSDSSVGTCDPSVKVGGFCPSAVFSGAVHINSGLADGVYVSSGLSNEGFKPLTAGYLASLLNHEESHWFQDSFRREATLKGIADDGVLAALHQGYVAESVPTTIQDFMCYDHYNGVTGKVCVSPGMMGSSGFAGQLWFQAPGVNPLTIAYTGGVVWRYWAEQFASLNLKAHPLAGPKNSIHPSDHNKALGRPERRSDEGLDLVARIVQTMAFHPFDPLFKEGTVDTILREQVGRSFENMMVDFHTAAILKDYKEIPGDDRWFFEWLGDFNAGVAVNPLAPSLPPPVPQKLSDLKPLPVPDDLFYRSSDQANRVHRLIDGYEKDPVTGHARARSFGPAFSAVSFNPESLDAFGAAYLTAFATDNPASNPSYTTSITIRPKIGAGLATRVFTIDPAGNPSLACATVSDPLPGVQDVCQCDPDGDCHFTVDITPQVKEVIVVVSNPHNTLASFLYAVGVASPAIKLFDPVTSHPASIGNKSNPKPVLAKFAIRNSKGEGVPYLVGSPPRFSVCPAPAGQSCELPSDAVKITPLGTGQYWAALTMPSWVYDDPSPTRDLTVEIMAGGAPLDTTEGKGALVIENTPRKTVMQVVLDRSGSMNDFDGAKLQAAKIATKLVAQNLLDTDELGLVTFDNDAQSPLRLFGATDHDDSPDHCLVPSGANRAIWGLSPTATQPDPRGDFTSVVDGIVAIGNTSIGDGALEGQSNLISKGYDKVTGNDPNLAMLILTDGLNNDNFMPDRYSIFEPYGGLTDSPDGADDFDPCDNGPWTGGISSKMSLPGRVGAGVLIPTVSTLAIGQDAFGPPLQILSEAGGGIFSFADATSLPTNKNHTTTKLVDSVLQSIHRMTGHQRAGTRAIEPGTTMPTFRVEAHAGDLVVSVVALDRSLNSLQLQGPDGTLVPPAQSGTDSVVFRVASPLQGTWTFAVPATASGFSPLEAFVEVAFLSPLVLRGYADVMEPVAPPLNSNSGAPFDAGRWVGKSVRLAAVVTDGHPRPDNRVSAHVTTPEGKESDVVLFDDGKHGDGAPGDGFFAARYLDTSVPGNYTATYTAQGLSTVTQDTFYREETVAFELHAAPDADGDGLPDWWENQNGTRVDSPDAGNDPDRDGLTNAEEFRLHTNPLRADTDGGGETDGSEVQKGQNPLNPSDDQARKYETRVVAGNGKVRFALRFDPTKGMTPEFRRSSQRDGVYETMTLRGAGGTAGPPSLAQSDTTQATLLATAATPATCAPIDGLTGAYECDAPNNTPFCYQARITSSDGTTDWSDPACVTAATDPYPPRIESFSLASNTPTTRTRQVSLRLDVTDNPSSHLADPLVDSTAAPQGAVALMLSTSATFAGASWQTYTSHPSFWLPDGAQSTLFAKVMDAAGNESSVAVLPLRIWAKTPVDEALHLEETALDQMQQGKWADGAKNIKNSLPKLKTSLLSLKKRVNCAKPDGTDLKILEGLLFVIVKKEESLLLANKWTGQLALKALRAALDKEREVASLAEQKGRDL